MHPGYSYCIVGHPNGLSAIYTVSSVGTSLCCHTEMPCRSVVVLFIDVECYTGHHNYLFKCLGSDPTEKCFPNFPHLKGKLYFNAIMVAFSMFSDKKVFSTLSHKPRSCGLRIKYAICSAISAFLYHYIGRLSKTVA